MYWLDQFQVHFFSFCLFVCFFIFYVCIYKLYRYYKAGALSILAMNLHPEKAVCLYLKEPLKRLAVHEYLMSPEVDATSRWLLK